MPLVSLELSSPFALKIIYALQFFGCDKWDIFRVLQSFGYRATADSFADFLRDEAFRPLLKSLEQCVISFKYENGLPSAIALTCLHEMPEDPPTRDVIARDSRGRMVYTGVGLDDWSPEYGTLVCHTGDPTCASYGILYHLEEEESGEEEQSGEEEH